MAKKPTKKKTAKKVRKQPIKKRPRGKPRAKYDYKKVEHYAYLGLDNEQIAACLGFSDRTLYTLKNTDPLFKAAIERGLAKGIAHAAGKVLKQIKDDNQRATEFFLKCKGGWKETNVNEHVGKDGKSLEAVSESERFARLLEIFAPAITGAGGRAVGPAGEAVVSNAGAAGSGEGKPG